MGRLNGCWGRASPRYEFCALSLDDFRQTLERGESLGPATHTQMSSPEDSTIRVAPGPNNRVHCPFPKESSYVVLCRRSVDRGLGRAGLG